MDRQFILDEIKRISMEHGGKPPGEKAFSKITGIRQHDWRGKPWNEWNNFGDVIEEAGFSRNSWQVAHSDKFLVERLIECTRELGRFPLKAALQRRASRDKRFPSEVAFQRRWNRAERLRRVADYCRAHPEFNDVLSLLPEAETRQGDSAEDDADSNASEGFVYLIKSGRHYKIGKTSSLERRYAELSYQTPEATEMVHRIRTDDPAGIERYWHDRFKDKRRKGEWFELTADDVKAFKRRKGFM